MQNNPQNSYRNQQRSQTDDSEIDSHHSPSPKTQHRRAVSQRVQRTKYTAYAADALEFRVQRVDVGGGGDAGVGGVSAGGAGTRRGRSRAPARRATRPKTARVGHQPRRSVARKVISIACPKFMNCPPPLGSPRFARGTEAGLAFPRFARGTAQRTRSVPPASRGNLEEGVLIYSCFLVSVFAVRLKHSPHPNPPRGRGGSRSSSPVHGGGWEGGCRETNAETLITSRTPP